MSRVRPADLAPAPRLTARGIGKRFDGVEVLRDVALDLAAGEVHALVGENGAGKTTLIRILAGVYQDYTGTMTLDGQPFAPRSPRDAEQRGLSVIHQELALVPELSAAENLFLGREPRSRLGLVRHRALRSAAADILRARLGVSLDVACPVAELPLAAQQLVEIAKALTRSTRVLIMDEPTSALAESDAARLFDLVRRLRDRGLAVLYISHKLEEIYALADRITVLRDGRHVGTAAAADLPRDRLVEWMVGRALSHTIPPRTAHPGAVRLRAAHLVLRDPGTGRRLVDDVSLTVRAGEIVGLAGLLGSGASEVLGAIFGRPEGRCAGRVEVDGVPMEPRTPRHALRRGVALLTNDRQTSGLVLPMSVLHNISLATVPACCRRGLLSRRLEHARAAPLIDRLRLRAPALDAPVTALSGGNQQKVLLARWLLTQPRVLLLDEPTRGIDVAAKADIYALLRALTAAGLGILLITSELPELLALADRVLVMHRGRIVTELRGPDATPQRVVQAAMGG